MAPIGHETPLKTGNPDRVQGPIVRQFSLPKKKRAPDPRSAAMLPSKPLARGLGLLAARPSTTTTYAAAAAAQACRTLLATIAAAAAPPTPRRTFTTTAPGAYKQKPVRDSDIPIPSPTAAHPEIPPYPYGERRLYKQSNTGLYGSASIRFGHNVSKKHAVKTPRKWRPNVQSRRLWSEALGMMVRTKITTRVLRTLDKVGGLDEYLLGSKAQRIKDLGPWGWRLRWRLMQTPAVQERFAAQRAALGLPPGGLAAAAGAAAAQFLPDGYTAESLMQETQTMLDTDQEFDLGGPEAEGALKPGVVDDGFMREEPKPSRRDTARP
ncbi:54S ribosomal protein L24 [Magnaporthiopsis poae ATCC 64411]|uniref:Large ribosomal subunit protein bL28m n=1 Tax=Magnaporthiopsis poae (strain ATCC 64411 / 73-15) TaxID=644358 RepID=A0A0C4E7D0_MAGP6|nr:54S ribosomal protein L24 [Magnaporthiopsis poae ATCC 64411]